MVIRSWSATKIRKLDNVALCDALQEQTPPLAFRMLLDEAIRRLRSMPRDAP